MLKPLTIRMPDHQIPKAPFFLKEKKTFTIDSYTTCLGEKISHVKVGYETYGKLNADGTNAILICHYFTGSSNAGGKYLESDPEPGYWDLVIGPGRAIDTNQFFVVAVDSLCNLCIGDSRVVTTGPASVNPATGKNYGMQFPLVGINDYVKVQKAVTDSLGIRKLHAVAGPSLGSMQVLQWAADYPEMVERVIAVIGGGLDSPAHVAAMVDFWASPITLDPNWNGGNYSAEKFPLDGLKQALRLVTMTALSPDWSEMIGGREFEKENPSTSFAAKYDVQQALDDIAMARLKLMDPNHFLYLVKAVQTFSVREKIDKMKAKFLFIAASSDLLMLPEYSKSACRDLKAKGLIAEYFELEGKGGHLDGLFAIDRAAHVIKKFLVS